MRVGMEGQQNAKSCNACSERDGRAFLKIVMMIFATLEKNGGGDVHKNTDYHREQLWRVWFQSGHGTDGRADGSHHAENEQAKISAAFGIAVV